MSTMTIFGYPVIEIESDCPPPKIVLGDLREYLAWSLTIPAKHCDEFIRLLRDGMLLLDDCDRGISKELAEYLHRWCEATGRVASD